jgi:hypothetical protein
MAGLAAGIVSSMNTIGFDKLALIDGRVQAVGEIAPWGLAI